MARQEKYCCILEVFPEASLMLSKKIQIGQIKIPNVQAMGRLAADLVLLGTEVSLTH